MHVFRLRFLYPQLAGDRQTTVGEGRSFASEPYTIDRCRKVSIFSISPKTVWLSTCPA